MVLVYQYVEVHNTSHSDMFYTNLKSTKSIGTQTHDYLNYTIQSLSSFITTLYGYLLSSLQSIIPVVSSIMIG